MGNLPIDVNISAKELWTDNLDKAGNYTFEVVVDNEALSVDIDATKKDTQVFLDDVLQVLGLVIN